MFKVESSAPGKLILHGEHAVVYGKAAIASSLSLRTNVTLMPNTGNKVKLKIICLNFQAEFDVDILSELSNFPLQESENSDENITLLTDEYLLELGKFIIKNVIHAETDPQKMSVITFLYLYVNICQKYLSLFLPCEVIIGSELSLGSGMGSSASYAVSLSSALLGACGKISPEMSDYDLELISKWAYEAEKVFHGHPSGIDNSICTYGGALLFKGGEVMEKTRTIPRFKILLVNTKVSRNTRSLVAVVREKKHMYPVPVNHILNAIESLTLRCWKLFQKTNEDSLDNIAVCENELKELIRINHHLLNSLDVGHPSLTKICDIAALHNCAAKLTGAGGGGCAFIMLPFKKEDEENVSSKLKKALTDESFEVYDTVVGGSGVQLKFTKL